MKLSREELRHIIEEAGSFEYAGGQAPDPFGTGEIMDKLAQGENVRGIERRRFDPSAAGRSHVAAQLAPEVAKAAAHVSEVVNRILQHDDYGKHTELIYREAGDAVASLQQVMAAIKAVRDESPDM